MLMKLVTWFRGFLCVRIRGVAPERFINLCCNKRIYIWEVRRVEEDYQFLISIKNYKKLRPIAKKTGMVPKITCKKGFPFLAHRYRKRKGFFLGITICTILVYIMSLYIWDISFLGGSKYTPEALTKFLNDNHIYTGIRKSKVNCQEIEEEIRLKYKDIGWVSAEIRGTRLIIKITETNMPAPAAKAIEPSHIIASKNAIIKSIITRTGTPLVREGDVVRKGDILVSGIVTIKADFDEVLRNQPVVADADIVCKSYYDYQDCFRMDYIHKLFTGSKKKGYYFELLGKKIFLYSPRNSYENYDIIVNENALHVTDSFYLPFRCGTITTREYEKQTKKYSEEEAKAIANARLDRYLKRLTGHNVIITDNNIKITIENNTCITKGRILVEEPAWEYKTVQDSEWRIDKKDEHSGDNH